MKKVLFVAAFVAVASSAAAQTRPIYAERMPEAARPIPATSALQQHPCDVAPPTNITITSSTPLTVGFCSTGKDLDGGDTAITQLRITVDGANGFLGQLPPPIGAPSGTGVNYYEQKIALVNPGQHQVVVYLSNANGETGSDPFAFALKGSAPAKPAVATIKK